MKKRIGSRKNQKIAMFICFIPAIIDMLFLKDVIHQMRPSMSGPIAGVLAFALALVADYMALEWGKKKGQRESGGFYLFIWIFLGIVYLFLRIASIYFDIIEPQNFTFGAIAYQVFAISYLTASYLITGLVLHQEAAKYWDLDITNYLEAKAEFDEQNRKNSQNQASLDSMVEALDNYDENYKSLEKQYNEIRNTIKKDEKSIMAQIVGRVIKDHPKVDPEDANKVMEKVLRERDEQNEASHQH